MTHRAELKLMAIVLVPYFAFFWLYFRIGHLAPVIVDVMILPVVLLVLLLVLRRLQAGRSFRPEGDERFNVRGVDKVRAVFCWAGASYFWGGWIIKRHGDTISDAILAPIFLAAYVGLLVSCIAGTIYTGMSIVAWRRKRRARLAS